MATNITGLIATFVIFLLGLLQTEAQTDQLTMDTAKVISKVDPNNIETVVNHLVKYGYMEQLPLFQLMNEEGRKIFEEGLKRYQGFVGLEKTGELDAETVKSLNLPRYACGSKDVIEKLGICLLYTSPSPRD